MSEKGKNPSERSKGGPRKKQAEQQLSGERLIDYADGGDQAQTAEALRELERKPNRP